jgi:hypothetical protein
MVDPSSGTPKAEEKGEKAGKEDVVKTGVSAGGIDQCVLAALCCGVAEVWVAGS